MKIATKAKKSLNIYTDALEESFWRSFAPDFSIGEKMPVDSLVLTPAQKATYRERLITEGYAHAAKAGLSAPFPEMAGLFTSIVTELGLPPVFSFIYDDPWRINARMRPLLAALFDGDYMGLPDFWAWRVMPGKAGWEPHRDRDAASLFPDNSPKCITVWVPITTAQPLNGCMYVVPAGNDPYYTANPQNKFTPALQDIRALPADPGDILAWTQSIFHWGGTAGEGYDLPPRMSIALEYQRSDVAAFHTPLLPPAYAPSFEQRLSLVARQILQYTHMYKFSGELVGLANAIHARYGLPAEAGAKTKTATITIS